jgi:DNA polymerase-3 subunit chi
VVQQDYEQGNKILIFVPNAEAGKFVDTLLWKLPPESFLPHIFASTKSQETVVITSTGENINQASTLINLNSQLHPTFSDFAKIYELYDASHPDKEAMSKKKFALYQEKGMSPSSLVNASFDVSDF